MDSFTVGAFWVYCLVLLMAAHLVALVLLIVRLRMLHLSQRKAEKGFIDHLKSLAIEHPETTLKDIVWISVEDFFQ